MTPSGGGAFGVQRWNAGEMGKIRSKRNRNHFLPCSAAEKRTSDQPGVDVVPLPETVMSCQSVLSLRDATKKQDKDCPTQKKDKRKLRHQQWIRKLEGCRKAREVSEFTEKRKKTVVVGDLQPLVAALPAVHEKDDANKAQAYKKYQKGKQFHQQRTSSNETSVLREVDHFQKVLEHSAFIKDPMSAITEHINNSVVKCVL